MSYSLEPSYLFYGELSRLLLKAGTDVKNKWFFTDGAFIPETQLQRTPNTWLHDNYVVICKKQIVAYFEATWSKPLSIITSFRFISFDYNSNRAIGNALFDFFEYLFNSRGCNALNWLVAEKNQHAYKIYEKFISNYFGHKVGFRHHGQMAYDGEVSDVLLYEITKEEFRNWKNNTVLQYKKKDA